MARCLVVAAMYGILHTQRENGYNDRELDGVCCAVTGDRQGRDNPGSAKRHPLAPTQPPAHSTGDGEAARAAGHGAVPLELLCPTE